MRPLFLTLSTIVVALTANACASEQAQPKRPLSFTNSAPAEETAAPKPPWVTCYDNFSPIGDAQQDLARLTAACGPGGGMQAIGPVHQGKQDQAQPVDRYRFHVSKADRCYRVYAAAGQSVSDLDLTVLDPNGKVLSSDTSHNSFPVLPADAPLCFKEPGLYTVEVSVNQGAGPYALQIWGI